MRIVLGIFGVLLLAGVLLWLHGTGEYDWGLPEPMPAPPVPADNPMSAAKVELGRWLFYDTRLSVNGTQSCGSCHMQAFAFADGRARALGATGELHPRSSMSLVNAAYLTRLTWANPMLAKLEDQALIPLFNERPVEMGMAGRSADIEALLVSDPRYKELFVAAFPETPEPHSVLFLVRAISAFVRSIVSFESPYDQFLRGDTTALSESAQRGMDLFFSERLECFHCHGGFNFTDSSTHASATVERVGFHNTGLYNVDGLGAYPAIDPGLIDMTGERRDMGRFRAPSLRNVALTAPYMHDGSIATLDEVIDHYARGGRQVESGPYAGDGRRNPYKSEFLRGFELSAAERADLLAFLHALTDPQVVENPAWSDPWR